MTDPAAPNAQTSPPPKPLRWHDLPGAPATGAVVGTLTKSEFLKNL